jgi:membrane associated rhomboid family serine protease
VRDLDNPIYRIRAPWVTWAIIAVNVAVFLVLNALPEGESVALLVSLAFKPSGVAPEVVARLPFVPADLPDLVEAFTAMFVQRDLWHLAGNMLCLWVFADNVEDAMGHAKFALFYVAAGLIATFVQGALMAEPQSVLFGASGAVSAVIAAYVMLHPNVRLWVIVLMRVPLKLSAFWVIGAWILYQFVNLALADPASGVGWWAHIAGVVAGALLTPVLKHPDVELFDFGPRTPAAAVPAEPRR